MDEFKEDTKKQFEEIREKPFKENKCLNNASENRNVRLMLKIIQDLKREFNKEIETLMRTEAEGRWN